MKITILLLTTLMLSGCATMERHPYITGFVVGSIAASIAANQHHDRDHGPTPRVNDPPRGVLFPIQPGPTVTPANGGG